MHKKITLILSCSLFVLLSVLSISCDERKTAFNSASPEVNSLTERRACLDKADTTEIIEKILSEEAVKPSDSVSIGHASGAISFSTKELEQYLPDPDKTKIAHISRPHRLKLSLQDSYARVLKHNFQIKTEGYGPAISATDILNAQSAFDAVYFLEANYTKTNQPTASTLVSSDSDTRLMSTGLAKLLPTGAKITGTYNLARNETSLQYVTLNPNYTSNFMVEFRQPFLRGFGLDINRSGIETAKNQQKIAKWKFRQTVRDTLFNMEKTFWTLVQVRRNAVIQKALVKQTQETLDFLEKRRAFDVYKVQITRVQALLGTRQAEYIQAINDVKNTEDQLKVMINDPKLNLGENIEIIPVDFPTIGPVVLDRIGEVQKALENRSELHEAKLAIENARIGVAVAKNKALPKFDLTFRYTINGLAANESNSFDQMKASNFQDYFVGISFEYPIGNRGPRSELRKAILSRDKAIAALKQVIEQIIFEVDVAFRNLSTAYYQVKPSLEAVRAAEENLSAVVARRTRLSPEYLDVRLNAQETLANAKRGLLNALVKYNIAIVELERAKDTLLHYNNISIQPK